MERKKFTIDNYESWLQRSSQKKEQINHFNLTFKSEKLEKKFAHFFYGRYVFCRGFLGFSALTIVLIMFNITQPAGYWIIGRSTVILMSVFCIFLLCCPCTVRRISCIELWMSLILIIGPIITASTDAVFEGLTYPYSGIKFGGIAFEIGVAVVVRPRLYLYIPICIINGIAISLIFVLYTYLNGDVYDPRLVITVITVLVNEFMVYMIVYILNYSVRRMFLNRRRLKRTQRILEQENQKTEILLYNILPEMFIQPIKDGRLSKGNFITKTIDEGCILQCDLINFTAWSSRLQSEVVTAILNKCFSFFDTLCEELGLQKLKTIGDAFVGFSEGNFNHMILLGIGIIESIKLINEAYNEGKLSKDVKSDKAVANRKVRVGIVGGKFVVSVMGSIGTKVNVDLFGDLTDRVTRYEETARTNAVHVDRYIKDRTEFNFKFHPGKTVSQEFLIPKLTSIDKSNSIDDLDLLRYSRSGIELDLPEDYSEQGPIAKRIGMFSRSGDDDDDSNVLDLVVPRSEEEIAEDEPLENEPEEIEGSGETVSSEHAVVEEDEGEGDSDTNNAGTIFSKEYQPTRQRLREEIVDLNPPIRVNTNTNTNRNPTESPVSIDSPVGGFTPFDQFQARRTDSPTESESPISSISQVSETEDWEVGSTADTVTSDASEEDYDEPYLVKDEDKDYYYDSFMIDDSMSSIVNPLYLERLRFRLHRCCAMFLDDQYLDEAEEEKKRKKEKVKLFGNGESESSETEENENFGSNSSKSEEDDSDRYTTNFDETKSYSESKLKKAKSSKENLASFISYESSTDLTSSLKKKIKKEKKKKKKKKKKKRKRRKRRKKKGKNKKKRRVSSGGRSQVLVKKDRRLAILYGEEYEHSVNSSQKRKKKRRRRRKERNSILSCLKRFRLCCCCSEGGYFYWCCCFANPFVEILCTLEIFLQTRFGNVLAHTPVLLVNILFLLNFVTSGEEKLGLFGQWNTVIVGMYVNILLEILTTVLLLLTLLMHESCLCYVKCFFSYCCAPVCTSIFGSLSQNNNNNKKKKKSGKSFIKETEGGGIYRMFNSARIVLGIVFYVIYLFTSLVVILGTRVQMGLFMSISSRYIPFEVHDHYIVNLMVFLVWDNGIPSVLKRLIVLGLDIPLFIAYLIFSRGIKSQESFGDVILPEIEYFIVGLLIFFLSEPVKEYSLKRSFESERQFVKQLRDFRKESQKNENLITSVLPKQIVHRIYKLGFQSFSTTMNHSFVIFMKIQNFSQNVMEYTDFKSGGSPNIRNLRNTNRERMNTISGKKDRKKRMRRKRRRRRQMEIVEERRVKQLLEFLTPLFIKFDEFVDENPKCINIKKIQNVFLFISRVDDEDVKRDMDNIGFEMIRTIRVIAKCIREFQSVVKDFNRKIMDLQKKQKEAEEQLGNNSPEQTEEQVKKKEFKPLGILSGLSYGKIGSGVLGTKKFLFDIFGDTVNLSARLCYHSMDGGIMISEANINPILYPVKRNVKLTKQGLIWLKGKGHIKCSTISLTDTQVLKKSLYK